MPGSQAQKSQFPSERLLRLLAETRVPTGPAAVHRRTRKQPLWQEAVASTREHLEGFWIQTLVGAVWAVIVGALGLLDIQPMALRLVCWPVLGIPNTAFFIWDVARERRHCSVGEYLSVSLLAAPFWALLAGLVLGIGVYGVVESGRSILGTF